MTSALLLAAAEAEGHRELPIPPAAFGIIALAVFAVLFMATFAFRFAASKHTTHDDTPPADH